MQYCSEMTWTPPDAVAPDPTLAFLLRAIAHAPVRPLAPIASGLRGWWVGAGWYVCASCAGRLLDRGCALPAPAIPVWADEPEPCGVCATCEENQ